ncbi:2-dehydropantoate 2-reductase [Rheinheimera sp. YQF-2]|uniref:2-dehydropantoate 2-reductase n=1 Tax=Rheinheimera lutimaris TaxID=2740584 RepID=A0A7Y5EKX9_9GAMM|nr:2-dehydropantoate 2-reductase [Rheinheimera lutimaris]
MLSEQAQDAGQHSTAGQRYCIGIVGAGSVGCYLGAHLCQDNALDVKFFGRETMALELAAHGLSVTSFDHHTYFAQPVAFYSSLNSLIECDVVLLTVKATALVPMLTQLKRFLRPEVPVVAMQNGIGIGEMLNQDLANPVLRAIVPFNVVKNRAGQFHRASAGAVVWQQNNHSAVNYVIQAFKQFKLPVQLCADITAAEYGKLLLNLNNALNAISDLPLLQQLLDRKWRLLLAAAMQEWLYICSKAGVKPLAYTPLPNALLPWFLRLPTALFRHAAGSLLAIDEQARSSMSDDIRSHKRTEIMFLNGAVVRMAQLHQITAPVNSLLVEQIKRLESGEAALPIDELLRQAGLKV